MITSLFVDGFKSLVNFSITFEKGLNVLVGVNGVGKTNICQSMRILASMPTNKLKNVLNELGGAGCIFTKNDLCKAGSRKKEFIIKMGGECTFDDPMTKEKYELTYDYELSVLLRRTGNLRINEILNVNRKNGEGTYVPLLKVQNEKKKLKYSVLNKDLLGDMKLTQEKFSLDIDDEDTLWWLLPKISIVCSVIAKDIHRIKSINIDPFIARQACDVMEPHLMLGNGKYLANALHKLNASQLDEINSLLESSLPCCFKVKPEISNLSLQRYFTLVDEKKNKFSSNSLSDGTVKLLGLLVGVINQEEYTMIIEEMENYLHPTVNSLLIQYLRETFNSGVCILTTHSETILNLIRPEELIICRSSDNLTSCHRISNMDAINEAINRTGFGCGYHYVKGNLSSL